MKHQSDTPIRAVGVIAEYNPFHTGHAYQLKKPGSCLERIIVLQPSAVILCSVAALLSLINIPAPLWHWNLEPIW